MREAIMWIYAASGLMPTPQLDLIRYRSLEQCQAALDHEIMIRTGYAKLDARCIPSAGAP